jgi:hypothetical protein
MLPRAQTACRVRNSRKEPVCACKHVHPAPSWEISGRKVSYLLAHVVTRGVQELYKDGHCTSVDDNLGVVGGA